MKFSILYFIFVHKKNAKNQIITFENNKFTSKNDKK